MVKFKAIIAMDKNGLIGKDDQLPWGIGNPNTTWDMANFKSMTSNKIVIMGYNTFKGFKRPLKNRLNLVLARPAEGEQFYSLKEDKPVLRHIGERLDKDSNAYKEAIEDENAYFNASPSSLVHEGIMVMPYQNENKNNDFSNKVNMTDYNIDKLLSFIPVETFDYRFIYIDKEKLLNDNIRKNNFEHLNINYKAAKDLFISAYKNSGQNNDSYTKVKDFNPSEVFIIGGKKTYEQCINFIDEFYVTEFSKSYEGNIYFDKDLLKKFKKSETIFTEPNGLGKIVRYYND